MSELFQNMMEPAVKPVRQMGALLRDYGPGKARADGLAAMTVAVVAIPQAMAFAMIAGVSPIVGLYGVIVQGIVGGLLVSSNHLVVGPSNTISLLTAAVATRFVGAGDPASVYLATVVGLSLVSGVIQIAFASAHLGTLFRYVSHSVIVGFTAGAGILIIAKQVPAFFGLAPGPVENPLPGLLGILQEVAPAAGGWNGAVLAISLVSLGVMLLARRVSSLVPAPLLAVLAGVGMVWLFGWEAADERVVGPLPRALPGFALPEIGWRGAQDMLIGGLAIALQGMMESVSIGKSIAQRTEDRIDPNQEFFALGATNLVSSFFGCFPGTGSFSRSALNYTAGARTKLAGVYASVLVAVALILLAPFGRYLPLASLAAILFVVGYQLIDWRHILRLIRTSGSDAAVCLATFAATLLTHLEYAIFVGIFLNLALYMRRAGELHMAEMVRTPAGPFEEKPVEDRSGQRQVMFLQVEGDLFFALADQLQDRLGAIARGGTRVVILRLKRTHVIDATVLGVLERFVDRMHAKGGHVLLCGVRGELMARMQGYGLVDRIGRENIFEPDYGVFTSAKRALARARVLVGSSIDIERELGDDELEGWAYQI